MFKIDFLNTPNFNAMFNPNNQSNFNILFNPTN